MKVSLKDAQLAIDLSNVGRFIVGSWTVSEFEGDGII